jgi:hypothetical protein
MDNSITQKNAFTYAKELEWLNKLIQSRLENHFSSKDKTNTIQIPLPGHQSEDSTYARWLLTHQLDSFERLVVISALACIYTPSTFDKFLIKNKGLDKRFTEFGGKIDDKNSRFIPTLETLTFLYFGTEIEAKFNAIKFFDEHHLFNKKGIVHFGIKNETDSVLSRVIHLNDEIIHKLTLGIDYKPDYSSDFPAQRITTEMEWEELIVNPLIGDELENVCTWLKYKDEIISNHLLRKKINKGYKCLFYGPPGTGKTLSSALIGKRYQKDVYRVDLSQLVSKYVGETEKNLAKIFNTAENKDWILFFDEAESLFSKRTSVNDSKDKFANQQTAYLLQRVEEYNGLIILATNLKPNIDNAFSRRIQTMINFTLPDIKERKILWKNFLNGLAQFEPMEIEKLARDHELAGGNIKNIVQFAWLLAKRNETPITIKEVLQGIRRELIKDGKSLNSV